MEEGRYKGALGEVYYTSNLVDYGCVLTADELVNDTIRYEYDIS